MTIRPTNLCRAAALALLAGCGRARLVDDGGLPGDAPSPARDSGPPPCIAGIRETACAWPGGPDAAAGTDARPPGPPGLGAPAMPYVFAGPPTNSLGQPLHPELFRPCARSTTFELENLGDQPLTVNDLRQTGSAEFSVVFETCRGSMLTTSNRLCHVQICFASQEPGTREGTLTWSTTAGDVKVSLSSVVLPWTDGLDPAFGNRGGALITGTTQRGGVRGASVLNDGATVAVWSAVDFDFVPASGALQPIPGSDLPGGVIDLRALRAGSPGQGIYALMGSGALIRFLDSGTRDMGFGASGAVALGGTSLSYGAIEVQTSGRALVLSTDSAFAGARAFLSNGDEDPTYRTSFNNYGKTAIDDRGRLYALTFNGVVRLLPDGGIDPGFSYSGLVQAMIVDRDQRLLVAAAGTLARIDDAGVATTMPLTAPPDIGNQITGVAVDARRRFLVMTNVGTVDRYRDDGTFDSRVGFSEPSASAIACPAQGGCWIAGSTFPVVTFHEDYVLRLAP